MHGDSFHELLALTYRSAFTDRSTEINTKKTMSMTYFHRTMMTIGSKKDKSIFSIDTFRLSPAKCSSAKIRKTNPTSKTLLLSSDRNCRRMIVIYPEMCQVKGKGSCTFCLNIFGRGKFHRRRKMRESKFDHGSSCDAM